MRMLYLSRVGRAVHLLECTRVLLLRACRIDDRHPHAECAPAGLAVDYSLHVMHTFLSTPGASRRERARATMLGIAAAVLLAVVSTAVGVVVLAASSSEIIRTFFKLLMGTVLFGGFMGLAVLPVLLALVGPSACLHDGSAAPLPGSTADAAAERKPEPADTGAQAAARESGVAP